MDPMMIAGLASSILGAFQDPSQMPPEVQRALKMLMNLSRQDRRFSAGVPGSAPGELAGLAQAKGLLGEDYANQRSQLMGLAGGMGGGQPGQWGDLLQSLGNQQTGGYANLYAQALQQFQQNRDAARQRAYGGFQAAGGMAAGAPRTGGGMDLSGMLGGLAHAYGMSQGSGKAPDTYHAAGRAAQPYSGPVIGAGGHDWGEGSAPGSVGATGVNYRGLANFQQFDPNQPYRSRF